MERRSAFELKRDSIREKNRSLAQPPCNQQFHFEDVKQKKQLKDFNTSTSNIPKQIMNIKK
jgi:hypothetical protein